MSIAIYTIGHSTRPVEKFIQILETYKIEKVVDVRTIAASKYNPQYNKAELSKSLNREHIGYVHCKGLGGLRHPLKASVNTGWRNASFRGYADFMQTMEFQENIEQLMELARDKRIVIMCAEALPWRCHRSLIGDALFIRNIAVIDIFSEKISKPHILTPFAKVQGLVITYPAS
ncbi:MAG: DUF488 domain-containing protein [Smithella sp.]